MEYENHPYEPHFNGWGGPQWEAWVDAQISGTSIWGVDSWRHNRALGKFSLSDEQVKEIKGIATTELNEACDAISRALGFLGRYTSSAHAQTDSGGWMKTRAGVDGSDELELSSLGHLFSCMPGKVKHSQLAQKYWLRVLFVSSVNYSDKRVRLQFWDVST